MSYSFKIFNVEDAADLYLYDNPNTDNELFRYEAKAIIVLNEDVDFGQIWVTDTDPKNDANGVTLYNPATNSFFGFTGKNTKENTNGAALDAKSLGGLSIFASNQTDKYYFKPHLTMPGAYRIIRMSNGANTTDYVTYNTDTQTVSLMTVEDDLNLTLPAAFNINWMLLRIDQDLPFGPVPA